MVVEAKFGIGSGWDGDGWGKEVGFAMEEKGVRVYTYRQTSQCTRDELVSE